MESDGDATDNVTTETGEQDDLIEASERDTGRPEDDDEEERDLSEIGQVDDNVSTHSDIESPGIGRE